MSNDSFFDQLSPKQSFLFGIGGGLLVLFSLGFFVLLGVYISGGGFDLAESGSVDKTAGNNQPQPQPTQPQPNQPSNSGNVDIANVTKEGEPFIGEKDAPVTMAYWYDYQCPFCKRFDFQTLSKLKKNYVDTGKLRVIFKNFAFLGEDSNTAALASEAVWQVSPDKWFEWHTKMFEKQDGENSGWGDKEDILEMTRTMDGIDADKVKQLMENKRSQLQQEAQGDNAEGRKFGVKGTPGFVLEKQSISGAQPYRNFKQIIESNL